MRALPRFLKSRTVRFADMRRRYNLRSKSLHPDRTSRLPLHVQYVANKVLAGLRYYMELYINLNHGGPAPSIDAPISADYPPFSSAEFAARCKVQPEDLTKDPFFPSRLIITLLRLMNNNWTTLRAKTFLLNHPLLIVSTLIFRIWAMVWKPLIFLTIFY